MGQMICFHFARKELFWQYQLQTFSPKGLNERAADVEPWALGDVWIDFENITVGGCGFKKENGRDVFVAALLSTCHLTADPADANLLID